MADIVYPGQTAAGPLNSGALPSNTDLVIYKGDFLRLNVTLTGPNGTPLDLTGATPRAALKTDYTDRSSRWFDCSLINPTAGTVEIYMSSASTSELLAGSYIWDFEIEFANAEVRTYLAGDVTVYNDVTSVPVVVAQT